MKKLLATIILLASTHVCYASVFPIDYETVQFVSVSDDGNFILTNSEKFADTTDILRGKISSIAPTISALVQGHDPYDSYCMIVDRPTVGSIRNVISITYGVCK